MNNSISNLLEEIAADVSKIAHELIRNRSKSFN